MEMFRNFTLGGNNLSVLEFFPGVRHSFRPSWMSCGASFKVVADIALRHGTTQLAVAEDDAELSRMGDGTFNIIQEYLQSRADWDIFSGMIADVHADTAVISAECFEGIQFVTINKMTSMVYNIYNTTALDILRSWDEDNDDVVSNTIDRYLEDKNLKVVVALPYAVGHRCA